MAKDTCKKEKCHLWGLFEGEGCPNFYRNTFYPEGKVDGSYTVDDCAPVRTMLMIQELHNRLIGVQRSNEQQRNVSGQAVEALKVIVKKLEEVRQIDGFRKDQTLSFAKEVNTE
jgi:hypothetical protein